MAEMGADAVPRHPAIEEETEDDEAQAFFDYGGGFLDEDTLVVGTVGTVGTDEEFGTGRHWLVDTARMRLINQLAYPFEMTGLPEALGDSTWYTTSGLDNALHIWAL
ncbi:hypothetical protein AB0O64_29475 [Streptomyces sp. NPDC088341]|uniref:hypothetical protein n=1 Tax=Streptomyces sp. NPDC088341 TaxID=3154870 RepID=UPI0034228D09